jgi:hypothetical protein
VPRFFIDIRDGHDLVCDEEGAVYGHVEEALSEAKASARDLVQQYVEDRMPLGATCVEVRDAQGRTVASLTVAEVLDHPVHPAFKNACDDTPAPGHR